MIKRLLSGLALLFLPVMTAPASTTYYVATNGNDAVGTAGTDWSTALLTITNAVVKSSAGDLILVSNGTYYATGLGQSFYNTNYIYLNKAVTLKSFSGNPADTILHGNGLTNRLVMMFNKDAVLDGFTITNGYSGGWDGGGVWVFDGGLITNCVISGNRSDATYNGGGGVVCRVWSGGGTITVANCAIIGNAAPLTPNVCCGGGGIYCASNATVMIIITNCDIAWNSTGFEGAGVCGSRNVKIYESRIYNNTVLSNLYGGGAAVSYYYGGPYLNNCSISNNKSTGNSTYGAGASRGSILDHCFVLNNTGYNGGGATYCTVSNNSSFVGNSAYYGGGVLGGLIYDSVFSNNYAQAGGGCGILWAGYSVVSNCLIVNNRTTPTGTGGGVYLYNDNGYNLQLHNCVIMDNTANDGAGIYLTRNNPLGVGMVANCLVARNSAAHDGGGVYAGYSMESSFQVVSCTIASNYATRYAGGFYVADTMTVSNSIICSNLAGSAYPNLTVGSAYNTNNFNYCLVRSSGLGGRGNLTNADPQFVDFNGADYHLAAGSPAINAGTNQPWMYLRQDLDNTNSRIIHGRVDIGCYEFSDGALSVTFGANTNWALAPSTNIFTAIVSGTNLDSLAYSWDFTADGTPDLEGSDLAVVTNIYTNAGYYSVVLRVANAVGETAGLTNAGYIKAGPLTYYVATNGACLWPFTNWAQAATDIYWAVAQANDGDTVVVSNGVYFATTAYGGKDYGYWYIPLNCGVTVRSLNGPEFTSVTRYPAKNDRIFVMNHSNSAVMGFTLTNGFTTGSYGVPNNGWGGAIFMYGGLVSNCVISGNTATNLGGGICMYNARPGVVANCVISGNISSNYAAGVYIYANGLLRNCLICSNVVNFTVSGAPANVNRGGGVYFNTGGTAENCTVVGNIASNLGAGVFCASGGRVLNSIIVSNTTYSGLSSNWYTNGSAAIAFSNCCVIPTNDLTGTGHVQAEPLFVDYAAGNFQLAAGSPCVDSGTNQAYWMPAGIDLAGIPRIRNGIVDLGAYEYDFYGPTNVAASDGAYADKIEVTWETVPEAGGYSVWRSQTNTTATAAWLGDAAGAPYADNTASTGVLYYYWVQATNAAAPTNSLFGPSDSGYIQDPAAPAPPSNVTASVAAWTDRIEITWSTNNDAAGYAVWRHATNDAASAVQLGRVEDVTVGVYTDAAVPAPGVVYYYWVMATNASRSSVFSTPAAPGLQALMPATNVIASKGLYTNQVTVIWQTNQCTNAAGYLVWRNAGADDLSSAQVLGGTTGTNWTDTGVATNVQYFYWIEPTNAVSASTNSGSLPDWGYCALWYYVATNGSDTNAGVNWATAFATISNGVAKAQRWLSGGVLVSNGEYTVTNQVFVTNGITVAGFSGRESTFINGNYPTTTNRAFWIQHASAVVDGFTITNCTAGDGGGGGAVYIATNGRVVNCVLAFNRATNTGHSGTGGGAVFMKAGGLLTNCVISNNLATAGLGGGVLMSGGGVLSNCTVVTNYSATDGSGYAGAGAWVEIWAAGQTCRVTGCVFSNNATPYYGGGIYFRQLGGASDAMLIDNCTFVTNRGPYNGGGIMADGGGVVSNCALLYNVALYSSGGYGAGASINGGRIVNCTNIVGNSGYRGGGIYLSAGGKAINCRVISNRSVNAGGGINVANGNGLATGCVMVANAAQYGGGFSADYGGWTVQDCIISNNSAQYYGGGIFINGRAGYTGLVERCEIVTNLVTDAGYSGGGMYVTWQGGLVRDCTFRGNSCFANGGGIYCGYWTGVVENCLFTENRHTADAGYGYGAGGGYFEQGAKVRNCVFTKNVAGSRAGAARLLSVGNRGGEFSACTVVSNKGAYTGGLRLDGTNNILLNSVIYSNIATANTSNDLYLVTEPASNTLIYNCTPVVLPGESNLTAYPKFLNPAIGDWRLAAGSPCINAGTNQVWMGDATDKDGHGRILGGAADMGAYEYPLYLQADPLVITNTAIMEEITNTPVALWNGDTNAPLIWTADTTNDWITLGPAGNTIAVNETNTLQVTNSAVGKSAGMYYGTVALTATSSLSALYPPQTQVVAVTLQVDWGVLGVPTNVQATDGAYADKVVVTWDTNLCTNALGYAVWRSLSDSIDTNAESMLSAASGTSYTDTSATNGVLYYYWVQATNLTAHSILSESNTGYRALAPPTGVTASDGSYSGKVVVAWQTNDCTNAVGYSVWRNTANDIASATLLVGAVGTNYDDTSAVSNILYYYWVQATNTLSQTNTSAGGPDTGYWALTYYVATNGSDANVGLDWTAPAASISNAVAQAQRWATGLVLVSNGTYTVTAEVAVTNSIRVRSWNAGAVDRENTLVSGGGAVRGFNVGHAGAVIEGLTVTNGAAPNSLGGGIYLASGLVTNCIISGNASSNGGGIALASANAALKNSLIAGNVSTNTYYYTGGGGVWMNAGLVTNCIISNNVAVRCGGGACLKGGKLTDCMIVTNRSLSAGFGYSGGGILIHNNPAATVANCTIMGNAFPGGDGGGISVVSGGVVTNCVIIYNRAGSGGGVYFQGYSVNQMIDCLISNNTASANGGGVLYYGDQNGNMVNCRVVGNNALGSYGGGIYGSPAMVIRQLLITGNSSPTFGGGVYALGGYISACTIASNYSGGGGGVMFVNRATAVTNSIIFSNKSGAAWTDIGFSGGTATLYHCCTPVTNTCLVADFCVTNAPQYVNFEAGNFRLGANSPCINTGTNEAWMDTALDLGGRPRIRYGRVDMGCYEYLLNVKVDGVPIDRILRINGVNQNRIFRINQ